jgi:hypothetical protein
VLIKQKIAELRASQACEDSALVLLDDTHLALTPSIF